MSTNQALIRYSVHFSHQLGLSDSDGYCLQASAHCSVVSTVIPFLQLVATFNFLCQAVYNSFTSYVAIHVELFSAPPVSRVEFRLVVQDTLRAMLVSIGTTQLQTAMKKESGFTMRIYRLLLSQRQVGLLCAFFIKSESWRFRATE